jgi:hypothetical protein
MGLPNLRPPSPRVHSSIGSVRSEHAQRDGLNSATRAIRSWSGWVALGASASYLLTGSSALGMTAAAAAFVWLGLQLARGLTSHGRGFVRGLSELPAQSFERLSGISFNPAGSQPLPQLEIRRMGRSPAGPRRQVWVLDPSQPQPVAAVGYVSPPRVHHRAPLPQTTSIRRELFQSPPRAPIGAAPPPSAALALPDPVPLRQRPVIPPLPLGRLEPARDLFAQPGFPNPPAEGSSLRARIGAPAPSATTPQPLPSVARAGGPSQRRAAAPSSPLSSRAAIGVAPPAMPPTGSAAQSRSATGAPAAARATVGPGAPRERRNEGRRELVNLAQQCQQTAASALGRAPIGRR